MKCIILFVVSVLVEVIPQSSTVKACCSKTKDNKSVIPILNDASIQSLSKTSVSPTFLNKSILSGMLLQLRKVVTTFYPVLSIFTLLAGLSFYSHKLLGIASFSLPAAMDLFMGGFFLIFSCMKMLNLKGFVDTYVVYDLLAMRFRTYAWLYPFIELFLGIAYLASGLMIYHVTLPTLFDVLLSNSKALHVATFVLMSFSSMGIFQAIQQKKNIRCACLGTYFNLPMTYLTLFEDGIMAGMALSHILTM